MDYLRPPKSVTDPRGLGLTEWPKHVHKAGTAPDGGPLYLVVQNSEEKAAAIAEGWFEKRQDAIDAANRAHREQQEQERVRSAEQNKKIASLFSRGYHDAGAGTPPADQASRKPGDESKADLLKRRALPPDIPSFGQQLTQAMDEARVSVEWLVAETAAAKEPINKRTIERLKVDERNPRIGTIGALEAALTKARKGVPIRFLLPITSRQRRKPRSPRKRSQNAAKRR